MQNFTIFLKKFFLLALRGAVIGVVALSVFLGGVFAVASASTSGGKFGEILNKILANNNWETSDGTVKRAEMLGGKSAAEYQIIQGKRQCDPGMCIVGFNTDGTIKCEK